MKSVKLMLRLPKELDCPLTKSDDLAEAFSEMAACTLTDQDGADDFVEMKVDTCNSCGIMKESGCYLDSAGFRIDGVMEWTVMAPSAAALDTLVERTVGRGCAVVIEEVTIIRTAKELTRNQEAVLQMALDMGYFDVPRKVTIKALANRLDMTTSTLEVILQRARHKVLADRMARE